VSQGHRRKEHKERKKKSRKFGAASQRNGITNEQTTQLQTALSSSECSIFRERVLILLLINDGKLLCIKQ
jgi:hypothetical protein